MKSTRNYNMSGERGAEHFTSGTVAWPSGPCGGCRDEIKQIFASQRTPVFLFVK